MLVTLKDLFLGIISVGFFIGIMAAFLYYFKICENCRNRINYGSRYSNESSSFGEFSEKARQSQKVRKFNSKSRENVISFDNSRKIKVLDEKTWILQNEIIIDDEMNNYRKSSVRLSRTLMNEDDMINKKDSVSDDNTPLTMSSITDFRNSQRDTLKDLNAIKEEGGEVLTFNDEKDQSGACSRMKTKFLTRFFAPKFCIFDILCIFTIRN